MSVGRLSGLGAWLIQRVSAVAILLFVAFTLVSFPVPDGFTAWRDFWSHPIVALGSALFVFSLLFHGWVGVRDVILDYVHPVGLRFLMLVLLAGWLLSLALWAAWLLLKMVQL